MRMKAQEKVLQQQLQSTPNPRDPFFYPPLGIMEVRDFSALKASHHVPGG